MFASDDSPATAFETPFDRAQINIADIFSQLILSPLLSNSVEMVVSTVETSLQALFKDVLEQYKVMSPANDGRETLIIVPTSHWVQVSNRNSQTKSKARDKPNSDRGMFVDNQIQYVPTTPIKYSFTAPRRAGTSSGFVLFLFTQPAV